MWLYEFWYESVQCRYQKFKVKKRERGHVKAGMGEIDIVVQVLRQLLPHPSVLFRILDTSPDPKKNQRLHCTFTSVPFLPPDPYTSDSSGSTLHTVTPLVSPPTHSVVNTRLPSHCHRPALPRSDSPYPPLTFLTFWWVTSPFP